MGVDRTTPLGRRKAAQYMRFTEARLRSLVTVAAAATEERTAEMRGNPAITLHRFCGSQVSHRAHYGLGKPKPAWLRLVRDGVVRDGHRRRDACSSLNPEKRANTALASDRTYATIRRKPAWLRHHRATVVCRRLPAESAAHGSPCRFLSERKSRSSPHRQQQA